MPEIAAQALCAVKNFQPLQRREKGCERAPRALFVLTFLPPGLRTSNFAAIINIFICLYELSHILNEIKV